MFTQEEGEAGERGGLLDGRGGEGRGKRREEGGSERREEEDRGERREGESDSLEGPDGGWGWLVVLACFCTTFTLDGIGYR